MTEKKITRKVISTHPSFGGKARVLPAEKSELQEELPKTARPKKACFFCQSKTNPSYIDTTVLRRFLTDRAKITPKAKSSICSKHQRQLARQIKYARHLSLLPFTPKV